MLIKNKDNLQMAYKFLKLTRLLPYWNQYLYFHKHRKGEIFVPDFENPIDIFGETCFTGYLTSLHKELKFKKAFNALSVYEYFAYFIWVMYPNKRNKLYLPSVSGYGYGSLVASIKEGRHIISKYLKIDVEKKTAYFVKDEEIFY